MKTRLSEACAFAKDNFKVAQKQMETWCDKHAQERQFKVGDQVLVLPVAGCPLQAKFIDLCTIVEKLDDLDYNVSTPERRKIIQLCHVNMLNQIIPRITYFLVTPGMVIESRFSAEKVKRIDMGFTWFMRTF